MWGASYFGKVYFAGTYWGPGGGGPVPPVPIVQTPSGGWKNVRDFLNRQYTKDDIRRERERLGIVPRQAKRIERVADDIIDKIYADSPNEILVQIRATQEYDTLLTQLAKSSAERRERIAEFVAVQMALRIRWNQEQEEAAILRLLMEL